MKKLLTIACVLISAAFANASELWWTVNTENTSAFEWDKAKLYATADGANFGGTEIASVDYSWFDLGGTQKSSIDGYTSSGTSFYVELWYQGEWVATSYTSMVGDKGVGTVGLGALSGSIANGPMSTPSPYAGFSSYSSNVIPEPTSGLMILLGLAALGLKRKRA